MRTYLLIFLCLVVFSFAFAGTPAYVHAAALSDGQIQSIVFLLSSFGVNQQIIDFVNTLLRGQSPTLETPTSSEEDAGAAAPPSSAPPETTSPPCATATNCSAENECATSGYFWYYGTCNTSPQPTMRINACKTAVSCTDSRSCTNAGFYWYVNKCNASPQVIPCVAADGCANQSNCLTGSFYWYDNACHSDIQTNSGASVYGLRALFPRFFSR